MVATVERAVYELSYRVGDSVQQVNAARGALSDLTNQTEAQSASEEKLSRVRRTATGDLQAIRSKVGDVVKSYEALDRLNTHGKMHPFGRMFGSASSVRLGHELDLLGLKNAQVTGALVRTRFGFAQLQDQADQTAPSLAAVNLAFSTIEQNGEPAAKAATTTARALLSVGAGSVAAIAGIAAAGAAIRALIADLATLERQAARSRMDTEEFQTSRFAANVAGVSDAAFATSAQGISDKLREAAQQENSLSKLLAANNVLWRERGKIVIDTNQALRIAADLISRGEDPQAKERIAEMLGVSKEMIPALERGVAAWDANKRTAGELGVVIDKELIAKASEFEREWNAAAAKSSAYLKRWSIVAINAARDVISQSFDNRGVDASAEALSGAKDQIQNAKTWGEGIAGAFSVMWDFLKKDFEGFVAHNEEQLNRMFDRSNTLANNRVREVFAILGDVAITTAVESRAASVRTLQSALESLGDSGWAASLRAGFKFLTTPVDFGGRPQGSKNTIIPDDKAEERASAWEREINRINRHTAVTLANAASVDQGAAAQAAFRAELQLLEAAQRAGLGVTEDQIDKYIALRTSMTAQQALVDAGITLNKRHAESFKKVAERAGEAAQAQAKARIDSEIRFQRDTLFLSDADVKIAQQLRQIYPDVATAIKSVEAAQIRLNDMLKTSQDRAAGFANTFVQGLIDGRGVIDSLKASLESMGKEMTSAGIKNIIKGPTSPIGYIEAGVGVVMQLIGKDDGIKQAKANWAGMADEVRAFNEAARGVNLQPLTQAIRQAHDTAASLWAAAVKAKDAIGAGLAVQDFVKFVNRTVDEFGRGGAVLDEFAQRLKDAVDQAAQLSEEVGLYQPHLDTVGLRAKINDGLQAITQQIGVDFTKDLQAKINEALGQGYLNQIGDLVTQRQQQLDTISALGAQGVNVDPALLDRYFAVQAQKIIDDAQLVGEAFNALTAQFPQLAGVVHEFTENMEEEAERLREATQQAVRSIADFLQGLFTGPQSPLSPGAQLTAAQSAYNANLTLAQGGNVDALNKFPQLADALLDAARAMFGSAAGYQTIFNQVVAQGTALPAVQASTDPVVVEILNAIAAIQAQTTAVGGFFTTQTTALQATIATGSASAIASALLPQFNALNTVVDQGLTLSELTAAGLGTDARLQQIFNELDVNSNGLISELELVRTSLIAAVQSNSPAAIASALNTHFNTLNTTVDQGLTLAELTAAGIATDARLQQIFAELDGNGNGILEKSELIRAATQGTDADTTTIANQQATANSTLAAIQTLQATAKDQLNLMTAAFTGSTISAPGGVAPPPSPNLQTTSLLLNRPSQYVGGNIAQGNQIIPTVISSTVIQALQKIEFNTAAIAHNTAERNVSAGGGFIYGQFAQGGTAAANTLAIFGEHHPQGPFAMRTREPVTFSPGMPSSDNGAVVIELRRLYDRIEQLEARLVAAERAGSERVTNAVDRNTSNRGERSKRSDQEVRFASRRKTG